MSTIVYFRSAAADISRGQGDTDLGGTTRQWSPLAMSTTRGSGVTSGTRTSIPGPNAGIEVGTTTEWISPPIDQDVTIDAANGDLAMNLWGLESAMTANASIGATVERLSNIGARVSTIGTFPLPVEMGTASSVHTAIVAPTTTNMLKGDRFRVRVYFDDAPTTSMTTGATLTFRYDGATTSADGDSFITFGETFGFQTPESALITQATDNFTGSPVYGGVSGGSEAAGQGFTLASAAAITSASLRLDKSGTPADNVVLDIVSSLGGSSLGSVTLAASTIANTGGVGADYLFTFSTPVSLAAGSYFLQLTRSGARSTASFIQWVGHSGNPYAGGTSWAQASAAWSNAAFGGALDNRFIIYASAITGSTIYLTDTASAVSTASVDREAWTSRGAGVQTDATNDATGPTAPIQVTDTLGGTVVDWWTKPLTAFTLDGLIACNIRALETNAGSNAAVRCEIAVTAGDGTGATVWGAATDNAELGTSEAAQTFYVAGDATSVTSGQRLRIRLSFDDAPGVAMANAGDLTLYYAGTTAAASGDTYITLPQTVTEASAGTTVSVTPGAVTFAGQSVLLKNTIAVTPGAITLAGQTVNTSVAAVVSVTPGAVAISGQTVLLRQSQAVGTGALTVTGQTVNVVIATVVPVTPGAVTVTGQAVLLRQSQSIGAGAVTITGQTVLLRTNLVVTPGAVTITGQTVNTLVAVVVGVTAGAVTVTGQTVNLLLATVVPVTPGAITLTGQTVNIGGATSVAVTPGAVTITGQTVLLRQSQSVGTGALTISGQTVPLRTNMVVTPGAVTLTGQTVVLPSTTTVTVTPAAVTLAGQAVGLSGAINVTATPAAVTLAGQTILLRNTVAVTPGAVTLTGQTVNTGGVVSVPVTTPGVVTFAGQAVNTLATIVVPVTPAAVTLAGQTILLRYSQAVTAGAVTFAGQTVNLLTAIVVPVTPAAVVLTGQTVNLKNTVAVTPGAVTLQGQTVNTGAVTTVTVTPGAITVTGQAVLLRNTVSVAPGALSLAGQTVGTIRTIPVTPGALTLAGQQVALRTLAALQPGTITITGLDVHLGIPEEYTVALGGRWKPLLILEGRHAPTVASRGAHRPTLVLNGVHVPTVTKAGASAP